MIWYGLRPQEARDACAALGLACRFTVTKDPKAALAGADATVGMDAKDAAETWEENAPPGIPRVIRAREEEGGIAFLLGYFAEGADSAGEKPAAFPGRQT